MARVTEEDREASHTRSDQRSKYGLVMAQVVVAWQGDDRASTPGSGFQR